jgi:hypothetical protein
MVKSYNEWSDMELENDKLFVKEVYAQGGGLKIDQYPR